MSLKNITFISFDTETSGKYAIESEICEIAAVKWRDGAVIDTYQTLIKPKVPMGEVVIKIHGITNEMVAQAPRISEVIGDFHKFIQDGTMIAHHAAFDMGFLSVAFEDAKLPLPSQPVICSSRLSRVVITDSPNHKLQTLIPHLGLKQGTAHRALDDAQACLELALVCFERGNLNTLEEVFDRQGGALNWKDFSVEELQFKSKSLGILIESMKTRQRVRLTYLSGSKPGRERTVEPLGLVRSPDGDYFVAYDDSSPFPKRFYIEKIAEITRI
jgi:DNA polymerase III subunit epsilon